MRYPKFLAAAAAGALLLHGAMPASADVRMCEVTMPGDADRSEAVTVTDLVKLTKYLLSMDRDISINADLSEDGALDAFDLALLKKMLFGDYIPNDYTGLFINEICVSNSESFSDAAGNSPDWIEIFNSAETDTDLSGFGLSDGQKNLFKYTFPEGTILPAGGYLVVCCDDAIVQNEGEHHAPFKLSATGETVYLTHPANGTIDLVEAPACDTDVCYGRYENGSQNLNYLTPTPGGTNDRAQKIVVVAAPEFSAESGFYDSQFDLTISSPEGVTIYYTTDGSDPRTSSAVQTYTGSISVQDRTYTQNVYSAITDIALDTYYPPSSNVDKGLIIRAVCADADGNFSDVVDKSYFIGQNENYYDTMRVISIVTDPVNLFDGDTGIYVVGNGYYAWKNSSEYDPSLDTWSTANPTNYNQSGRESERPVTLQVFENGTLAYEEAVGMRIAGNATRSHYQKSLRFFARSDYGASKMEYAFFDEMTDIFGNPITSFDKISLRNGGNDITETRMRDDLIQALSEGLDLSVQGSEPCVVFIDGEFWGYYTIREREDDAYFASHYGLEKENITVIQAYEPEGDQSVYQSYVDFYDWAMTADLSLEENYQKVLDTIDIQSFMDYITVETYVAAYDWCNPTWTNNWLMWRSNTVVEGNEYGDGKWRYALYDMEYSSGLYGANETSYSYDTIGNLNREEDWGNIGALFYKLLENPDFCEAFRENYIRIADEYFNYERVDAMITEMDAMQKDALMATNERFYNSYGSKLNSWYSSEVNELRDFYRNRRDYALRYLDALIPAAPVQPGENILQSQSAWRDYFNGSAAGTVTINNLTSVTMQTTSTSSEGWHMQASYVGFPLTGGKSYTLTFTAKADRELTFGAHVQEAYGNYQTFLMEDFTVGTTAQTYTFTFTPGYDADPSQLGFDGAYSTGTVEITDISLVMNE